MFIPRHKEVYLYTYASYVYLHGVPKVPETFENPTEN